MYMRGIHEGIIHLVFYCRHCWKRRIKIFHGSKVLWMNAGKKMHYSKRISIVEKSRGRNNVVRLLSCRSLLTMGLLPAPFLLEFVSVTGGHEYSLRALSSIITRFFLSVTKFRFSHTRYRRYRIIMMWCLVSSMSYELSLVLWVDK